MKEMTGNTDSNRSERQGGFHEELSTKEVRSKDTTAGTQTDREAAMRAISVRANAKSNRRQKTHQVESGGTGRKFMHLTRGGLASESTRGVSRGRSSEEGRESGWSKGPKNQQKASANRPSQAGARSPTKPSGAATAAATGMGDGNPGGGTARGTRRVGASMRRTRKEAAEDA